MCAFNVAPRDHVCNSRKKRLDPAFQPKREGVVDFMTAYTDVYGQHMPDKNVIRLYMARKEVRGYPLPRAHLFVATSIQEMQRK